MIALAAWTIDEEPEYNPSVIPAGTIITLEQAIEIINAAIERQVRECED